MKQKHCEDNNSVAKIFGLLIQALSIKKICWFLF
jgi:hypothetical protein